MTPEGKVKAYLKKRLTEIGAWQYWPVSMGMGAHGIPDCVGCYKGRFFGIETKAPGKRGHKDRGCTKLQIMQLKSIAASGGMAAVVDGPEETDRVIITLIGEKDAHTDD